MNETQPEALRLADELKSAVQTYPQTSEDDPGGYYSEIDYTMDCAANELHRLYTCVQELLRALEQCRFALEPYDDIKPRDWKTDRERLRFAHQSAHAAITKAKGESQ